MRERLLADDVDRRRGARARRRDGNDRGRCLEARRRVRPRDRAVLQRRRVLPVGYRLAERVLNLFYKVTVEYEDARALAELPRDSVRRLPDEPPLERRLRARQLRARRPGRDLVRGRRMGARVSARVHVQGVRVVLRAAEISRAAVPRGARALRAAHHARGRDAGNLSRGRPHARRPPQVAEDRTARLRARHRARRAVSLAHLHRAGGGELRPRARGPLAACASWRRAKGGRVRRASRNSARSGATSGGTWRAS